MGTKLIFFCLIITVCINISSTANAQAVNEQDSLALVDLYNSTNGGGWDFQGNWLNGPVATWYGITMAETRVIEIFLRGCNLTGSIPSSLGNLTNLIILDLDKNQINGSIPPEVGNLTNLTLLDLDDNKLSGSIPSSIGNLTYLREINLQLNQLYFTTGKSVHFYRQKIGISR